MVENFLRLLSESNFCENPLTVASNAGFFAVALFLFWKIRVKRKLAWGFYLLPLGLLLIGIGSSTYHAADYVWASAVDIIGIYLVVFTYLFLVLKKVTKSTVGASFVVVSILGVQLALFFKLPYAVYDLPVHHLVNAFFFVPLAIWIVRKLKSKQKEKLVLAMGVYLLAIGVRYFDPVICSANGVGTHWLWHLLVAATAYLASDLLVDLH